MNTGQMMIGITAMGLVAYIILNFSNSSLSTQDSIIYSKEFIVATTLAQSTLDEISDKFYDEVVAEGKTIKSEKDFSSTLGTDASEVYPNFDDVDDYNNFNKTEIVPQMGEFTVSVQVEYMTDGLVKSGTKTYNKNVTIYVTSPTLYNYYSEKPDTLVLSSLFSKWTIL